MSGYQDFKAVMDPEGEHEDRDSSAGYSPDQGGTQDEPDAGSSATPLKTGKKRGRHMVSCAECRRLKLRCDRQVPCGNCLKRKCAEICPHGTRKRDTRKKSLPQESTSENAILRHEKERLERLLAAHGISSHDDQSDHGHPPYSYQTDDRGQVPLDDRLAGPSRVPYSAQRTQDDWGNAHRLHTLASHASAISPHSVTDNKPFEPIQRGQSGAGGSSWTDNRHEESRRGTTPSGNLAYGTLVLGDSGRSRYLGPSAGTEWIRKSERPEASRPSSPSLDEPREAPTTNWPFAMHGTYYTTDELFAKLPEEEEGRALINAYFRFFAWNHNPVPRQHVDQILAKAYAPRASRCHIQQLALIYSIFAMGTLHSLEYEPNDPIAEQYRQLSQACLSKGDFLMQNTIPGVQALYVLGHYYSESERGKTGDQAWPLWGIAMRLVQAMGVHRDGSRWNLPWEVVEERRLVFWECHTMDLFQSHCFSRPTVMRPKHSDTQFPSETGRVGPETVISPPFIGEFQRWKYELARIFEGALDQALNVEPPPYSYITSLYDRLCSFERSIPYHMRCRTALLATPSRCYDQDVAIKESPEVNRMDLRRTLEQFTLALDITEAILFLQRPYFARALQEEPMDAMKSKYAQSFLAVVERCNVTTQIVCGLVELFPRVAVRHWFYWYHLFNAAVCIGTLLLRSPHSPVAPYALSVLDQAIGAYTIAVNQVGSASLKRNHGWLVRLRQKGGDRVTNIADPTKLVPPNDVDGEGGGEADDGEGLLAWRTRLIERASEGIKRATSISTSDPSPTPRQSISIPSLSNVTPSNCLPDLLHANGTAEARRMLTIGGGASGTGGMPTGEGQVLPSPMLDLGLGTMSTADAVMQQHFVQPRMDLSNDFVDPNNAMDVLLNQFWDPVLLPDQMDPNAHSQPSGLGFNSINWWTMDPGEQSSGNHGLIP